LTIKLLLILLFLLFTTPTATHALARAAIADGLQPDDDAGKRDGEEPSNT
jgi:multicomponent Na+:H+ antiporter subunit G